MKTEIKVTKVVDIKTLLIDIPLDVGHGDDDDVPPDFPLLNGNRWVAKVDIDMGVIHDWPVSSPSLKLFAKICDRGTYRLYDVNDNQITQLVNEYVPNELIPGEYGDYINLEIHPTGMITNWYKRPSLENFFED